MKKLFLILMAAGLFVSACNNNKGKDNFNTNNREKDDYRNNDNSGNNGGGWTSEQKQKSLNACMTEVKDKLDEGTAQRYCSCVLDEFMKKYPTYEEADKTENEQEGELIGKKCANELGIPTNENGSDNTGGWPAADKQRYLNECVSSAVNSGTDEQIASSYCDCTLEILQKRYKNYTEAQTSLTDQELADIRKQCAGGQNQ